MLIGIGVILTATVLILLLFSPVEDPTFVHNSYEELPTGDISFVPSYRWL